MRLLTWRFWVPVVVLAVAWAFAGVDYGFQMHADLWVYRIGLSGTTVAAALFIIVWTSYALLKPESARWWKTDLATSLVAVTASFLPGDGALAWVFDFGNGSLHEGMLGWTALSGPMISMVAIGWCAWLWMLTLERKRSKKPAPEETR